MILINKISFFYHSWNSLSSACEQFICMQVHLKLKIWTNHHGGKKKTIQVHLTAVCVRVVSSGLYQAYELWVSALYKGTMKCTVHKCMFLNDEQCSLYVTVVFILALL